MNKRPYVAPDSTRTNMIKAKVFGGSFLHFKNAPFLFFVSSLFSVTEGLCTGCEANQTCCGQVCINGSTCVGRHCTREWKCPEGETCCRKTCVSGASCVGQTCSSRSDCKVDESCCTGECRSGNGCIGEPCWTKDDCGHSEYCCRDTCTSVDYSVTSRIVFASVFGTPLVILVIYLTVYFAYQRYKRAGGAGIEGHREITETSGTEAKPVYLGRSLPSYQEEDPYYPPPEYMEYPLCSVESCEPPPLYSSYSGAPENMSSTQNNYGAVQNSDLPV